MASSLAQLKRLKEPVKTRRRPPVRCSLMLRLWPLPWASTPHKRSDKIKNGPRVGPFLSFIIFLETKFLLHETHVVTHRWSGSGVA